jgi:hypothetical protein
MADNGNTSQQWIANMIEWDTVTKIGYRANQGRATTVKGNTSINAAARSGTLQTEKKFTGTPPTVLHINLWFSWVKYQSRTKYRRTETHENRSGKRSCTASKSRLVGWQSYCKSASRENSTLKTIRPCSENQRKTFRYQRYTFPLGGDS